LAAVLAAAPVRAQSTNTTTPNPTPSPAPTGNAVGPPTLRDFNLNGTVTQPAQPATPTPTPSPTPAPTQTAPTAPRATPTPASVASAPDPSAAAPDRDPAPGTATIDLPPPTAAPTAPAPSFAPAPDPVVTAPVAAAELGNAWWLWLAALLEVGLGALIWWRRQQQSEQRYAADNASFDALVAAPDPTPSPLPRSASPTPAPTPRAVPRPIPVPPAAPIPDGIFASRLKPQIEFELVPIRAETDAAEGAALTFDIIVINRGSAPARDVLIEAQLINAGPQVDAEVGRFFMRPGGDSERVPVIQPMGRFAINARIEVPGEDLSPLVVEGRKLLVPLIAINALYRWSGGELKDSSSFLVGRGEANEGKLAPFRLDRGARSWSGLAARLHSSGLQR